MAAAGILLFLALAVLAIVYAEQVAFVAHSLFCLVAWLGMLVGALALIGALAFVVCILRPLERRRS
jgi:hypothetical protein